MHWLAFVKSLCDPLFSRLPLARTITITKHEGNDVLRHLSRASGKHALGLKKETPNMYMRCPHCGRLLAGLRHDHAVLCAREGALQALRTEIPETSAREPEMAVLTSIFPRYEKVQLSEQELNDLLDGKLTRSELSVHKKSA
jgi:hypothetical protein